MAMLLIGTAMLLAAMVYAVVTLIEVTLAAEPEARALPRRKREPEPEENPYPIGSDELWTWQPTK